VQDSGVYNWEPLELILQQIAGRKHHAIFRFYFTYPGQATTVPDYIKNKPDYKETIGTSEGLTTRFPDWSSQALQQFTIEFYSQFAQQYDQDTRIAFLQTGFGLWGEYHIYDGPFILGQTFPSKDFQSHFLVHLDSILPTIPWSISVDAANDSYSPFLAEPSLLDIEFGVFDDSFMHELHATENAPNWDFFKKQRYLHSPAGGEFSYYTAYDQQNVLQEAGLYGITFEQAAREFHITYMIGNDQPEYHSMQRIKEASLACGYSFTVLAFYSQYDSTYVKITNTGTAPLYHPAYPAVNSIPSHQSLMGLAPNDTALFSIGTVQSNPVFSIESPYLYAGTTIPFNAQLLPPVGIATKPANNPALWLLNPNAQGTKSQFNALGQWRQYNTQWPNLYHIPKSREPDL
jgi:hypothetical protein